MAEKEQRTILFVSHQMAAIQRLCDNGILFHHGKISCLGKMPNVISAYMNSLQGSDNPFDSFQERRVGSGEIRINKICYRLSDNSLIESAISGQDLIIDLYYSASEGKPIDLTRVICGLLISDQLGDPLIHTHNRLTGNQFNHYSANGIFRVLIKKLPLPRAEYFIGFSLFNYENYLDGLDCATSLYVEDGDFYGTGEVSPISHCKFLVESSWSTEADENK